MTAAIKTEALRLGFSGCGVTRAGPLPSLRPFYTDFIARGGHQSFSYLERYTEQRLNISLLLPQVKSVIAVLMNYYPPELIPENDNYIVSKYAYGSD
jgi:epoxyqueuosine reductase